MKIKLGVNIDHIATLRQVRGGTTEYPNLVKLAQLAIKSGAHQITIHLREDRRHIQLDDLIKLSKIKNISLNLEMAATAEMLKNAKKYKPEWICLVPEKREELTTEGGLDVVKIETYLSEYIHELKKNGCKVSLFIAGDKNQVHAAHRLQADAVEFHTGHWVLSRGKEQQKQWQQLVASAQLAHELGLRVHAGHGLDLNTSKKIKKLPHLVEVNIGHSIICYSIEWGLAKTIKLFRTCLK